MNRILPLSLILAAASPAAAADRNFGVSGFEKIRVDGPFMVRVSTGVAPYAQARGPASALDTLAIEMQGRTLVVKRNRSSAGAAGQGAVEVTIGTHELSSAVLNGSGALAIDQVRGQAFDIAVQGAGAATIGRVELDDLKAAIAGSGSIRIGGSAARLTAVVRGVSTFDGAGLSVKDATIGAEGAATVRAQVSGTARIEAHGPATVQLTGSPACTSRLAGSASVSGCRVSGGLFDR